MSNVINNFNAVEYLMNFEDPDDFYFLQILKRRKDNPDMERDMEVIRDFYLYKGDLEHLKDVIIKICESENARAYLRINKRNAEKIALQTVKRTIDLVISKNYKAVKRVYSSICGEFHSDPNKKWIVDMDNDLEIDSNEISLFIQSLIYETGKDDTLHLINTKNGYHIICYPFNLQKFKEKYPSQPEIHKDNPTLLYAP